MLKRKMLCVCFYAFIQFVYSFKYSRHIESLLTHID